MSIGLVSNQRASANQSLLSTPVLWTVRVLAWLAFGFASYLALKSLGHGVSSGCVGGGGDCDAVQSSIWSVWLGVPVAILGLGCYSALATLSVLAGFTNRQTARWVSTALLMFSLLAAFSGLWFIGLQFFALGKVCIECMAVHACGITIAGLVLWGLYRGTSPTLPVQNLGPGMAALRGSAPEGSSAVSTSVNRGMLTPGAPRPAMGAGKPNSRPSLAFGLGGAVAMVLLMVSGQLLFPANGSTTERVALASGNANNGSTTTGADPTTGKEPHVAKKIATDDNGGEEQLPDANLANSPDGKSSTTDENTSEPKKRIVTFLNGMVSLDVYKVPVLGSREAPHFALEFVSYDCPHCHEMHRIMRRAMERYGDEVSVIVLVLPYGIECNKEITTAAKSTAGACIIAKMALGVSSISPAKFAKFHDWIMEPKAGPPSPASVVQKAHNTVSRERIMNLSENDFKKQVELNLDLFNKVHTERGIDPKQAKLPLIILGGVIQSGVPASADAFLKSWEEEFGVKPSASATDVLP